MKTLIAAAVVASLGLPAAAASITNGSFTGPVGNNVLPVGWTSLSFSPDTNDLMTAGGGFFNYVVSPPAESNDGGTWVGIAGGALVERFGQLVIGFSIGESYTLEWEQYNSGATFQAGYNSPAAFEVSLDAVVVGTGAISALGGDWITTSTTFTATATEHFLSFGLATSGNAYMNIDGVRFVDTMAPVPVPPAGLALMAGLGGLAVLRRRKARQDAPTTA